MVEDLVYKNLLSDSTLSSVVKGHIYPQALAAVKTPEYPCICFEAEGTPWDQNIPYSMCRIRFWVVSKKSYREALVIYGYIKDALDKKSFRDNDVYVVFSKDSEPSRYFDASGEGLYYATGVYRAYKIEK